MAADPEESPFDGGRYTGVPRYNANGLYRLSDRFVAEVYALITWREPEGSADLLRHKLYKELTYDEVQTLVGQYLLCRSPDEAVLEIQTDSGLSKESKGRT